MYSLKFSKWLYSTGLVAACAFSHSSANADIIVDGNITDWITQDRLELATSQQVSDYELYGRYETNSYKILLRSLSGTISSNTTFWLNTDQDSATGYLVWGYASGAEYNINIAADGKPYLYSDSAGETLVSGPLEYNISTDGSGENLEVVVPEALIGTPTGDGINLLIDVNNATFLPSSYWPHSNNYILEKNTIFANAGITIDADKSDWKAKDRLDLDSSNAVTGVEIYGRFESDKYKFLIHDYNTASIGTYSTLWLNTDQDHDTGHKIWGFAGGAEYNINFFTDGKPYLYTGDAGQTYVGGPLEYATVSDGSGGSILELEVPKTLIGSPSGDGINLLADLNNTTFLPTSFWPHSNNYVLNHQTGNAPIAIVYSETTQANFFDSKAYAQLFMSVQAQAMMAGIPFDLLSESDLLDIDTISKYKTLVVPSFANVDESLLSGIEFNLSTAVNTHNVGIVTAGNFLTNTATNASLPGDAYSRMKSLMGVQRIDGGGPFALSYRVTNTSHPVTSSVFTQNESLKEYTSAYTDYFEPTGSYSSTILATQTLNGTDVKNALITTENGGRHAHFGTVQQMVDSNILWSVLQWSVYGEKAPASLQMSRSNSLFVSRNDMDQSMFIDQVAAVEGELLTYLQLWKQNYNFVGSYYINVGADAVNGEQTDWSYSAPLYQQYIAISNEIGTHSYTHPHDTNILTDAQLEYQFADSRSVIESNLNITNLSAAVPGAPEDLATSLETIKHVDYLTGGYSGSGAGYPNAIGFLNPSQAKVYMSPNMSFDFTLVEYQQRTAAEAQQVWIEEFETLVKHTPLALVHWPWHDYGPTNSDNAGYTFQMFDELIKKAYNHGSEFVTGADFADRIKTFKSTTLDVTQSGQTITAKVGGNPTGKFALKMADGTTIASVNNWYAYDDNQVFLANGGGDYTINLGTPNTTVSRISALPKRSELTSLSGDGTDLTFEFNGEGTVEVSLKCTPSSLTVSGGTSTFTYSTANVISLTFTGDIQHAATTVDATCP